MYLAYSTQKFTVVLAGILYNYLLIIESVKG